MRIHTRLAAGLNLVACLLLAGCYQAPPADDAAPGPDRSPTLESTIDSGFAAHRPAVGQLYRDLAKRAAEFQNWKQFNEALGEATDNARLSAFDPFNTELTARLYGPEKDEQGNPTGKPNLKAKYDSDRVKAVCDEIADHLLGPQSEK